MRPTHRLLLQHTLRLQQTLRLTLFTRENCSLCTTAKSVLGRVWDERPFEFREVDVMQAGQERWKALYEYDTPVVHIDRITSTLSSGAPEDDETTMTTTAAAQKLMHRFAEGEVHRIMDAVEKNRS